MAEIPLLDHITAIADSEIADLRNTAEAEAARITEEARTRADRMVTDTREQVRAEADRIRERRMNSIRFAHNARLYDRKSRALADLWREAAAEMAAVETSGRYPALLKALFAEGASLAPDGSTVHTSPGDRDAVVKLAEASGKRFEVVEDKSVHGGVAFYWPDGGTVLINTLSHRLARLRAEGNEEISHILFAGDREAAP